MYIDSKLINGKVYVSERDTNGDLHIKTHLPPYMFYYKSEGGKYTSIYDDPLEAKRYTNRRAFNGALKKYRDAGHTIFESDVNPVFRLLEERYPNNQELPDVHIGIIDIEVDKDPARGWSSPTNPYALINAVSVYDKFNDQLITLAVPPPTLSYDEARELLDSDDDEFGSLTEEDSLTFLCRDEAELLIGFLEIIEDLDVLSGWNSEFYDLPYIINRIRMTLGGENSMDFLEEDGSYEYPLNPSEESKPYLLQLGRFPCMPSIRMVERYGSQEKTYHIHGRIHLDYLELFRKFTNDELHSYKLDFVLKKVIGESKIEYEGSLDELYRNEFKKFVAYNRQDVAGLANLDKKAKYINLANMMSHMAGVTFDKVTGSVAIIEQAILRVLHNNKRICFDRVESDVKGVVPGAFVISPNAGMYDWVCSYDIASLYPSVIRSLNISPEVIVGQFKLTETNQKIREYMQEALANKPNPSPTVIKKVASEAWRQFIGVLEYHHIIDEDDCDLTLELEGVDDELTYTAKQWKDVLCENNWSISAYGTVFKNDKQGIVAECLSAWYTERADTKAESIKLFQQAEKETNKAVKKELLDSAVYFDNEQQVRKLFLNSTYGAYLNRFFRFYDPRLGASVTLSGRLITHHMATAMGSIIDDEVNGIE